MKKMLQKSSRNQTDDKTKKKKKKQKQNNMKPKKSLIEWSSVLIFICLQLRRTHHLRFKLSSWEMQLFPYSHPGLCYHRGVQAS